MSDDSPRPIPVPAVLAMARATLSRPGAWIRERFAADALGFERQPGDGRAVYFNPVAAICRADGSTYYNPSPAIYALAEVVAAEVPGRDWALTPFIVILEWNDDPRRTLPEVLEAFDRAAEKAKSEDSGLTKEGETA